MPNPRTVSETSREAMSKNQRAWISYDTLYVDGRPVHTDENTP